jgi:HSP20 family protein
MPRRIPSVYRPVLPNVVPTGGRTIPVDVTDFGDAFVVEADLPGFRKQQVDVSVEGSRVEVVAHPPDEGEGGGPFAKRRQGKAPLRRVVTLPEPVYETRASASFADGVLEVRLPKRRTDVEVQ